MIKTQLLQHIIRLIAWHRTWLAVTDTINIAETIRLLPNGTIIRHCCHALKFEVRVAREGFYKRQIINLPVSDIYDAIQTLSADRGFAKRIESLTLNYKDVNMIIHCASRGTISLELEA